VKFKVVDFVQYRHDLLRWAVTVSVVTDIGPGPSWTLEQIESHRTLFSETTVFESEEEARKWRDKSVLITTERLEHGEFDK